MLVGHYVIDSDRLIMKQSDIDSMSVGEKLQAIEALWEALEDSDVEPPAWHDDVLKERVELLNNGKAKWVSLEELKQRKFNGQ